MDNIFHAKEEEGVFFGEFNYTTEGVLCGKYEAKCSQTCLNIILQQEKFIEGLAVSMDEGALVAALDTLNTNHYFGIPKLKKMENLVFVNWRQGHMEIFGSLLAHYHVLMSEGLKLLPLSATHHPKVAAANNQPECARGYFYYLNDHWMVLRNICDNWYKFDPWLGGPQLLSHFYVSLYILQLATDGKLVFVIDGEFPLCPAEEIQKQTVNESGEEEPEVSISYMTETELAESLRFLDLVFEGEDNELALACSLSAEDNLRQEKERQKLEELTKKVLQSSLSTCDDLKDQAGFEASTSITETQVACGVAKRKQGTSVSPVLNNESNTKQFNAIVRDFDTSFTDILGITLPLDESVNQQLSSNEQLLGAVSITTADKNSFRIVLPASQVVDPEKETTTKKDETENCCICWAASVSHVVVPCGHFCLCSECVVTIQKQEPGSIQCPLCKRISSSIIKLYK